MFWQLEKEVMLQTLILHITYESHLESYLVFLGTVEKLYCQ